MPAETTDTLIVGGGQAGLAMSEHLGNAGVEHIILERDRIAERWRSARWDSLVANGPAWHDRFPTREFTKSGRDGFPHKDEVADYFEEFAKQIKAPIRCGVEVLSVEKISGHAGFRAVTTQGVIEAKNIVAATGPFQTPIIPPVIPETAKVLQIHSNAYRNPGQLPEGAVMVIGAGSSGAQIADELLRSGREVYLSVGAHDRPPRSYRGRDFVWWLGVLGKWDAQAMPSGSEHVTIAVSGAHGGETVDFRHFAERGMTLVGLTEKYENGKLHFAPDLARNIERGDANYLSVLKEADAYVSRNGLDLPEEPEAHIIGPVPECVSDPLLELDLEANGVTSVIWATGYGVNYDWLKVDVLDDEGRPRHQRGVSPEAGIYFLGLPWQSRRGSSFIWGVWHDAKYLADHIVTQQKYMEYHQSALSS